MNWSSMILQGAFSRKSVVKKIQIWMVYFLYPIRLLKFCFEKSWCYIFHMEKAFSLHEQIKYVHLSLFSLYESINGILLPKLFWPTVRKYCSSDRENFFKNFEITRTICSNSERSEQFLVTQCFFNLFLEVSQLW